MSATVEGDIEDRPVEVAALPTFRADIEGLRGVAILVVVLYHARISRLSGGYIGVDVFFVLSGFLITGLLIRELASTGRVSFWGFYARRFRRLAPALMVMLFGSLFVGALVASPVDVDGWIRTGRGVPPFLTNLIYAHRATDYLAGDTRHELFLHTWSLAVEEQFYLVWPGLLAVAAWFATRWRGAVAATIGVVTVASGIAGVLLTTHAPEVAFFGPISRFWEFGIGALVAFVPARLAPKRMLATAASSLGLLVVVASSLVLDDATPFPGTAAALPVAGTALLLFGGLGSAGAAGWVLTVRPLRWLGQRSYSWYLWHWPALVLLEVLRPASGTAFTLAAVLAALAVAHVSYRWVENPVRHAPSLVANPRRTTWLGLGAIAVSLALLGGLGLVSANRVRSTGAKAFTAASSDHAANLDDGCFVEFAATRPNLSPRCAEGDTASDETLAVFGDSHAGAWMPALDRIGKGDHLRVEIYGKSYCPPTLGVALIYNRQRYTACDDFRRSAIAEINRRKPTHIIITSFSTYVDRADQDISAADWETGMARTIRALEPSGADITVLHDVPTASFSVPGCLQRRSAIIRIDVGSCTFPRTSAHADAVAAAERRAAARTGARTIETATAVCPSDPCQPVVDGTVIYFDSSHLTATYARHLAPWLDKALAYG